MIKLPGIPEGYKGVVYPAGYPPGQRKIIIDEKDQLDQKDVKHKLSELKDDWSFFWYGFIPSYLKCTYDPIICWLYEGLGGGKIGKLHTNKPWIIGSSKYVTPEWKSTVVSIEKHREESLFKYINTCEYTDNDGNRWFCVADRLKMPAFLSDKNPVVINVANIVNISNNTSLHLKAAGNVALVCFEKMRVTNEDTKAKSSDIKQNKW